MYGCTTMTKDMKSDIYSFTAKDSSGKEVSFDIYKGKVLLIVNSASKCAFTSQYKDLQYLYDKYKDRGFFVLAFPCNQFAHQEPGNDKDIQTFCSINYGVTFPVFSKIDVNGKNAHPLFKYLKSVQGGFLTDSIKWNFTKFLINRKGEVIARYAPVVSPLKIEGDIEKALARIFHKN